MIFFSQERSFARGLETETTLCATCTVLNGILYDWHVILLVVLYWGTLASNRFLASTANNILLRSARSVAPHKHRGLLTWYVHTDISSLQEQDAGTTAERRLFAQYEFWMTFSIRNLHWDKNGNIILDSIHFVCQLSAKSFQLLIREAAADSEAWWPERWQRTGMTITSVHFEALRMRSKRFHPRPSRSRSTNEVHSRRWLRVTVECVHDCVWTRSFECDDYIELMVLERFIATCHFSQSTGTRKHVQTFVLSGARVSSCQVRNIPKVNWKIAVSQIWIDNMERHMTRSYFSYP